MTTKTPYEIRADLLVLAQKICYDRCLAEANVNDEQMQVAPTTQEILDEAKKLNYFVSYASDREKDSNS